MWSAGCVSKTYSKWKCFINYIMFWVFSSTWRNYILQIKLSSYEPRTKNQTHRPLYMKPWILTHTLPLIDLFWKLFVLFCYIKLIVMVIIVMFPVLYLKWLPHLNFCVLKLGAPTISILSNFCPPLNPPQPVNNDRPLL